MRQRSKFRPCIDLHDGKVKQIVGGTLSDNSPEQLKVNFASNRSAAEFATLYKENGLTGGHIIKLGPGNDSAAKEALEAWPGALQIGGGIDDTNARDWISHGASKVIITSFLFPDRKFSLERLQRISQLVGTNKLVVDLSCRKRGTSWFVAMNKWQDITDMEISEVNSSFMQQILKGLCQGIDEALVQKLGEWTTLPTTYAGGAKDLTDLDLVDRLSNGKVDLTYGSSLDIFGGNLVKFSDLVAKSQSENI